MTNFTPFITLKLGTQYFCGFSAQGCETTLVLTPHPAHAMKFATKDDLFQYVQALEPDRHTVLLDGACRVTLISPVKPETPASGEGQAS